MSFIPYTARYWNKLIYELRVACTKSCKKSDELVQVQKNCKKSSVLYLILLDLTYTKLNDFAS